jgi:quercetin dioxygenase-like cupin family protein
MIGKKAAVAAAIVAAMAPCGASAQIAISSDETMAGQPLVAPSGAMEMLATRDVVPAGTVIDVHMHFWPRYVFVESGEVQVKMLDGGPIITFKAGEMIVEPLQKWHSGLVTKKAVLIAVEQVPPGQCNTIKPPVKGEANDHCPRK